MNYPDYDIDQIFDTSEVQPILLDNKRWPIGAYYAVIHPLNSRITKTKSGKKCIKWELHVLGPTHQDLVVYKWSMLEGTGLAFTKGHLATLNRFPRTQSEIKKTFGHLKCACVNIEIIPENNLCRYNTIEFLSLCSSDHLQGGPKEYLKNLLWK